MLYLTTGTPGAGKTLWTIATVEARRKRENREVYFFNIKGLTLDWKELTLEQVMRWWELPHGAIIVIDEAQDVFPKGSTSTKPPEHADRIAKHRHGGFDIYLVSQHPMKLDSNVRKDVEEHRHLMRKFGTHWSTVHLWKGCRDNCDKTRKDSIATQWRYPAEVFDWYKSAEVHTVRLAVPWKVWAVLAVPVFIGVLTWWVFWGRTSMRAPAEPAPGAQPAKLEAQRALGPASASGRRYQAPQSPAAYLTSYKPRIEGLPHTAPRYDDLTAPVRVPVVVGCWRTESGTEGWCITQQGSRLKLPQIVIAAFIESGQFVDFDPGPELGQMQGKSENGQPGATRPAKGVH